MIHSLKSYWSGLLLRGWSVLGLGLGVAVLAVACHAWLPWSNSTPTNPAVTLTNLVDPAQAWDFTPQPDRFSPQALLDLRYLNEESAGQSGFIRRSPDGQDFVTGAGQPIRFWAVNTEVWKSHPTAMADHARFLAKRGVNMVRWHGQIPSPNPGDGLSAINLTARDQLWRLVAAMKQQGIYTTLSPYFAAGLPLQPEWPVPRDSDTMMGLLFFDPVVQAAYKDWWRALLEPVNPYTGLALKDDPAVALLQLQNEDSLLFWTLERLKGRDLDLLLARYWDWLMTKYGSLDRILAAWQQSSIEGDNPSQGRLRLAHIWELTQSPPVDGAHRSRLPLGQNSKDTGRAQRLADQTEFLTTTMMDFHRAMVEFLRQEIGVKALINANNWKTADTTRLNDAERYGYSPGDVMAVNRYYGGLHTGQYSGWAIVAGDRFTDPSVLFQPNQLPTNLKQVSGYPMVITESSWVPPLSYQSEGPFLVSLFQSLTGVDGFYWFQLNQPQWRSPDSANGYLPSLGKWIADTPELLGNFPAAALIYRQGYVETGTPVVEEHRPLEALWQRQAPLISEESSFDPNRDQQLPKGQSLTQTSVHPLAFLVGPVQVSYGRDRTQSKVMDLSPYLNPRRKTLTSITGEITWDYGQGLCLLNSPKAQGATGFLQARGAIKLRDLTITASNPYATVMVVAMDGQPLPQSEKILVQVGTTARPTGWQQKPVEWTDEQGNRQKGYEVVSYGAPPWQVANTDMALEFHHTAIRRAQALDMNGQALGDLPLQRRDQGFSLRLPPNAMYVVLTSG